MFLIKYLVALGAENIYCLIYIFSGGHNILAPEEEAAVLYPEVFSILMSLYA
jgi:hypothetical protein